MRLILNNLRIPLENDSVREYLNAAAVKLAVPAENIQFVKMAGKSLDARSKTQFYYEVSIVVQLPDSYKNPDDYPLHVENPKIKPRQLTLPKRPIIIGFGPAGMFTALELIERGLQPLIFERGRRIEERDADVLKFLNEGRLDEESNIQFGEGGAGAYSDGKLFSRIKNTAHTAKTLDTFIKFGAPKEIAYVGRPHLGTDVLCGIVKNIRHYILEKGGEIHYESKATDLIIKNSSALGVIINSNREYTSEHIFAAIGHSARDTFEMLHAKGVFLEQKPISVGARLEHPADIINLMRYGKKYKDFPGLGASNYSFTHNNKATGRGVFTFCMCPGGEIINASSKEGELVVNGMSYAARNSKYSNAAIVVTCHTADYRSAEPLAGIKFQREIERRAFEMGGKNWKAPAQNLLDFLEGRVSKHLLPNSFKTGVTAADMGGLFPSFITQALKEAFIRWKTEEPLFVSEHGLMLGAETRTSSPVRITRTEQFESVNIKNLYPIGEGSGYSGGISSSATDAIKAVEAVFG